MAATTSNTLTGIIRGKIIELAEEPGLPDGQVVTIVIQLPAPTETPEEGLRKAFGACAQEADDLDSYVAWTREQRKVGRKPRQQ